MVGGAYAGGSVWSAGVGACASGIGCVLQSIIRNTFGYIAISIVSNRKTSFYVIAEKWLKRNYTMKGRDWEGERRGGKRVRKRDVGRVCRGSIDEPVAGRMRAVSGRMRAGWERYIGGAVLRHDFIALSLDQE